MSQLRWALFVVPVVVLLGLGAGRLANSSGENRWFEALIKPAIQPPDYLFGIVWPLLYVMMGLALAMVLHARGSRLRGLGVTLFVAQLVVNLIWSPLFFAAHQVSAAFWWILLMLALALATTLVFARIRAAAAWLMVPYLAWLSFAAVLNYEVDRLNPEAETLVPGGTSYQL